MIRKSQIQNQRSAAAPPPSIAPKPKAKKKQVNKNSPPPPKPEPKGKPKARKSNKQKSKTPKTVKTPIAMQRAKLTEFQGTALQGFKSSGGDSTSATHEIVIRYTDYFDIGPNTYCQYLFNVEGTNTGNSAGSGSSWFARVTKCSWYVMPKFVGTSTDSSLTLVGFTLPVINATEDFEYCVNQRTTEILPTPNSKWKYVGGFKASKVFNYSDIEPSYRIATDDEGNETGVRTKDMCLGTVGLIDSDSLALSTQKVQAKIVFEVATPMAVVSTAVCNAVSGTNTAMWYSPENEVAATSRPIVAEYVRVQDAV